MERGDPGSVGTLGTRGGQPRDRRPLLPLVAEMDVRALLPSIPVPTLVIQHTDDLLIPPEWGKDLADRVPGAKYVELPGRNVIHFYEPDWRASFQEIAEFLTGKQADVYTSAVIRLSRSTRRAARLWRKPLRQPRRGMPRW